MSQVQSQNVRFYIHAIVFGWSPDLENPFQIFPRDALHDVDEWLDGKFGYVERQKIISLPSIDEDPDSKYSVFCKVERGK